ncbi:MAG: sodium/proton-translocating pyrophosphatase [Firmicutes bacterium]|nr:sodium/proton-translocating pyrophosphatase [Bacillota bacterium]
MTLVPLIWIAGALAAATVVYLVWDVVRQDKGTPRMQEIAAAIREGAFAFLSRQYRTIAVLAVVAALLLAFFAAKPGERVYLAVAFLSGAALSALSGYIGIEGLFILSGAFLLINTVWVRLKLYKETPKTLFR